MRKFLIVNTGSASKKYAVYAEDKQIAFLHLETEEKNYISTFTFGDKSIKADITNKEFEKSLDYLFSLLKEENIIYDKTDITGVGMRIVAPGLYFQKNRVIDKEYITNLKIAVKKAPLHLELALKEIDILKKFFGKSVRIAGISDSEFHSTMSERAKYYAINHHDAKKYEIYRYGYHGLSAKSIVHKLEKKSGVPERLIICHLGGGVSIMAVKGGKSIDTSMGFTPLEGMVMANRVGDIDSGAVIYLSEVLKLNSVKLRQYFNKQSGLLGLSDGFSNDIRDLFKREEETGYPIITRALDTYVYKIQKQIGSYFVALGGLDKIVFTGTIGERSFKMRKRICDGLGPLGIYINENKNLSCDGVDCDLTSDNSKVKVEVVKTNEMSQIVTETLKVLEY